MRTILFIILVGIFCLNATDGYAQKLQIKQPNTVRMSKGLVPDAASALNRKVIQAINQASLPTYYADEKVYKVCQRIDGFHSEKICLSWATSMKKKDPHFQVTAVEQTRRNPYGLSTGKLLVVFYSFKGKTQYQIFAQAYGGWYMIKGTLEELNTLPPSTNSERQQKRPLIWT